MKSPQDESSLPRDGTGARPDRRGDDRASPDASTPSLSRWYRASTREAEERARHLEQISGSLAAASAGFGRRDTQSPADRHVRSMQEERGTGGSQIRASGVAEPRRPSGAIASISVGEATHATHDTAEAERTGDREASRHTASPHERLAPAGFAVRASRSPWVRAAALVAFAAGGISLLAISHPDPSLQTAAALTRDVAFALRLPDATVRQVSLAGDFNAWDASTLPMVRDPSDGTWRVRVPLAPGRHTYSFVVDGTRWVIDPLAPRTVEGALGPANVIAVSGDT